MKLPVIPNRTTGDVAFICGFCGSILWSGVWKSKAGPAVCQYKCEKRFNKGNMIGIRCSRNCFPACYILCFICLLLHNRELFIHKWLWFSMDCSWFIRWAVFTSDHNTFLLITISHICLLRRMGQTKLIVIFAFAVARSTALQVSDMTLL